MEPEQSTELHDWEVLAAPGHDIALPTPSISHEKLTQLDVFDGDSDIIRSDHFSLLRHDDCVSDSFHRDDSVHSDDNNPSWIDPAFEVSPSNRRISAESWSDSSCDDLKFSDSELQTGFHAAGNENLGSEEVSRIESPGADSGTDGNEAVDVGKTAEGAKFEGGGESRVRTIVWWNLPIQLIKYCVFKASPVWSVSLAAAVTGLVILGQRLYKMKRKSRSLQLKVTVDEKKVSQFMTHAGRLNEAFSVARRVPMIRPSLPAAGVTPSWSMISMR